MLPCTNLSFISHIYPPEKKKHSAKPDHQRYKRHHVSETAVLFPCYAPQWIGETTVMEALETRRRGKCQPGIRGRCQPAQRFMQDIQVTFGMEAHEAGKLARTPESHQWTMMRATFYKRPAAWWWVVFPLFHFFSPLFKPPSTLPSPTALLLFQLVS